MRTNKINSKYEKRHSSITFAVVVCVYWYTGLSLACYLENDSRYILYVVMIIFFRILFVWQENDWGFSSEFEKIALKKKHKNSPLLYTHAHTTPIKSEHDKVSISGPQGKGTQILYKTIKSCVIADCRRLIFCLYS